MQNSFTKILKRTVINMKTAAFGYKGVNITPMTMAVGAMIAAGTYPELSSGAAIATYLASGLTLGGIVGGITNLSVKHLEQHPTEQMDARTQDSWKRYQAELLHETDRDLGKRASFHPK